MNCDHVPFELSIDGGEALCSLCNERLHLVHQWASENEGVVDASKIARAIMSCGDQVCAFDTLEGLTEAFPEFNWKVLMDAAFEEWQNA